MQEVFAVAVLPGRRYPDLINEDEKLLENSFVVPDEALADVPAALRTGRHDPSVTAGSPGPGLTTKEQPCINFPISASTLPRRKALVPTLRVGTVFLPLRGA